LEPKSKDMSETDVVALDCEMVGVGKSGMLSALARVCVLNSSGNVLLDKFARPSRPVTDYRARWSGVREKDLLNAQDVSVVQAEVRRLLEGKIIVGHALVNDFKVLSMTHPKSMVRDTAKYRPLCRGNGKPRKLKHIAFEVLGAEIQMGEHSPATDARAALYIYQALKEPWERSIEEQQRLRDLELLSSKIDEAVVEDANLTSKKETNEEDEEAIGDADEGSESSSSSSGDEEEVQ
jgi:RNA exonuclease 4